MSDKAKPENGVVVPFESSNDWPDAGTSHELMEVVLDHYMKHHGVVLKKLQYAQSATAQSIREIEAMCRKLPADGEAGKFEDVQKYDGLWGRIIEMFGVCGVSEDELQAVENILVKIPKAIKTYYDALVQQDKALLAAIGELSSEKYKKAFEAVGKIQSRPDPLSGLDPSVFKGANDVEAHIFRALPKKKDGKKKR